MLETPRKRYRKFNAGKGNDMEIKRRERKGNGGEMAGNGKKIT